MSKLFQFPLVQNLGMIETLESNPVTIARSESFYFYSNALKKEA